MGRRGPQRDPSKPNSRGGNRRESSEALRVAAQAKVYAKRPDAPTTMSPGAVAVWDETVDELYNLGMICNLDKGLLAEYCELMVILSALRAGLYEPAKGRKKPEPSATFDKKLDQIDKVLKSVNRIGDSFGLTPKGRRAMGITTQHSIGTKTDDTGKAKPHPKFNPGLVFDDQGP